MAAYCHRIMKKKRRNDGCSNDMEADKCVHAVPKNREAQRAAFRILDFTMENYIGAENPARYKGTGKVFSLL